MKNFKKYTFIAGMFFSLIFGLLFTAQAVYSQHGLDRTAARAGLNRYGNSIPDIVGNIIGAGLSFIAVFFFILMVYGGFVWMTAHGNEEQIKKALNTIVAAIIGIIIVLASYAITTFVFNSVRAPVSGGACADTPNRDAVQCAGITCAGLDQNSCNAQQAGCCTFTPAGT